MNIKINEVRYTFYEYAFLMIWTVYSFSEFVLNSELGIDYIGFQFVARIIAYATIFFQILVLYVVNRYKLVAFCKYAIFLLVVSLIELNVSSKELLVYALFIILAQYMDVDKLIRYDIKLKCVMLVIIVGLCLLGITENYTVVVNGVYKQSIGFTHPNTFTCYILTIMIEWLCLRYKVMRFYEFLLIILVAFATMRIGGGRSSVYSFFTILFIFFISKRSPNFFNGKIIKLAFTLATPLMAAISFIAVWLYKQGNAIAIELNSLLSSRLYYAVRYFDTYDIKWFGQEMVFVGSRSAGMQGTTSAILDSAYIRCLLLWGLIAFAFVMLAYCALMLKLMNSHRVDLALLSLFFIIIGFGENYMLNVLYNVSLLYLLGFNNTEKQLIVPDEKNKCHQRRKSTVRIKVEHPFRFVKF